MGGGGIEEKGLRDRDNSVGITGQGQGGEEECIRVMEKMQLKKERWHACILLGQI